MTEEEKEIGLSKCTKDGTFSFAAGGWIEFYNKNHDSATGRFGRGGIAPEGEDFEDTVKTLLSRGAITEDQASTMRAVRKKFMEEDAANMPLEDHLGRPMARNGKVPTGLQVPFNDGVNEMMTPEYPLMQDSLQAGGFSYSRRIRGVNYTVLDRNGTIPASHIRQILHGLDLANAAAPDGLLPRDRVGITVDCRSVREEILKTRPDATTDPSWRSVAFVDLKQPHQITVNTAAIFNRVRPREEMEPNRAKVASPRLSRTATTIIHETGHQIDAYTQGAKMVFDLNQRIPNGTSAISRYAKTNIYESYAESFVAHTLKGQSGAQLPLVKRTAKRDGWR